MSTVDSFEFQAENVQRDAVDENDVILKRQKRNVIIIYATMFIPIAISVVLETNPEYLSRFSQDFRESIIKRTMLFYAVYCAVFMFLLLALPIKPVEKQKTNPDDKQKS